jgi:hypothetical protein
MMMILMMIIIIMTITINDDDDGVSEQITTRGVMKSMLHTDQARMYEYKMKSNKT